MIWQIKSAMILCIETQITMKTFSKTSIPKRTLVGFGLVELLVTVSIIGVMAAMAVSVWGANHDVYEGVRAKRNAQELASECYTASVAGVHFVVPTSLEATLEKIMIGAVPTSGAFAGRSFGLVHLSDEDIEEATQYLEIRDGVLAYNPEG